MAGIIAIKKSKDMHKVQAINYGESYIADGQPINLGGQRPDAKHLFTENLKNP